jgi:hypothetical protein
LFDLFSSAASSRILYYNGANLFYGQYSQDVWT